MTQYDCKISNDWRATCFCNFFVQLPCQDQCKDRCLGAHTRQPRGLMLNSRGFLALVFQTQRTFLGICFFVGGNWKQVFQRPFNSEDSSKAPAEATYLIVTVTWTKATPPWKLICWSLPQNVRMFVLLFLGCPCTAIYCVLPYVITYYLLPLNFWSNCLSGSIKVWPNPAK